jgi:RNA methyltransferase, TrmH family
MPPPGLSAGQRRLLQHLRQRRARTETGLFVAEGVRVTEELLRAGIVPRFAVASSALEDTARGSKLRVALEEVTDVHDVSDHELARLAATDTPQGVLVAARIPACDAGALALPERCHVLVLDGVQDPGNFGALVRCAAAFAASAVIALPGTVDAWNAKAIRAAAGMSFRLPVVTLPAQPAVAWLRDRAFVIHAAALRGVPPPAVAPAARRALVVGNEGAGLREPFASAADVHISIPIADGVESLNVAVAAGILMYALAQEHP